MDELKNLERKNVQRTQKLEPLERITLAIQ